MAQDLSAATQRRITLLAILPTVGGDLDAALEIFTAIEEDGRFFDAGGRDSRPTSAPRGRSDKPAFSGRSSRSGNSRGSGGGQWDGRMQNPDGPPSEKQVGKLLSLTDDYTADEIWDMSKKEVSDLISDLV
jgi:hypothetical protein